jgi:glutamate formiminotransferase
LGRRIVECVPNFSEGRDAAKVDSIEEVIARGPGVAVLGKTMDPDHNRSVITFVGNPENVAEAALRAVAKASELIDLTAHKGVHPRIGATDVLPFVPVDGVTMDECVALAESVAEQIWERLRIPAYLYEEAARRPERKGLENIRRGDFEHLRRVSATDPERRPDVGGPELHPTAGATVVGARQFLIAYNVNLASEDVSVAKDIARSIRTSSGGFPYVKALGLRLERRRQVQVSMNLTDFHHTPVHIVYEAIREKASALGVEIAGSEIIGLVPKAVLEQAAAHCLRCENFTPEIVLENRLAEVLPYTVYDVLDDISTPSRAGGGGAAALAGAMAAALGVLVCRLTRRDESAFEEHRHFFRAAADRDGQARGELLRTSQGATEAIEEATETPLAIAERALVLSSDLQELCAKCPRRYVSDVITAIGLATAAKSGAIATVELNLSDVKDDRRRSAVEERLRTLN